MDWQCDPGVPVLVPRRDDGGRRDKVWQTIRERVWRDANVIEGHHTDGPFNRSAAVNTAAREAGDWDVAVIADSDSLTIPNQVHAAVTLARASGRLVIAHSRWVNITLDEQNDFLGAGWISHDDNRMAYTFTVSSMLAVPRTVWDTINGMDEHFIGWGWEDRAFARAARVLTGDPLRIHGDVYHLAHDRPDEDTNRGSSPLFRNNRERGRLYSRIRTPEQMTELVADNRCSPQ